MTIEKSVEENNTKRERSFRAKLLGELAESLGIKDTFRGRYKGMTPKQAAKKAVTSIYKKVKKMDLKTPKTIKLILKESTHNSKKKEYHYIGKKIKLVDPSVVKMPDVDKNGKKIVKEILREYKSVAENTVFEEEKKKET